MLDDVQQAGVPGVPGVPAAARGVQPGDVPGGVSGVTGGVPASVTEGVTGSAPGGVPGYIRSHDINAGRDLMAVEKFASVFTGNRKRDRQAIVEGLSLVGITNIDVCMSLKLSLQSENPSVAAAARHDISKILGAYAPEQVEVEANQYASMTHDELVVSLLADLVSRGVVPKEALAGYKDKILGKVRFGGMLVEPGDVAPGAGDRKVRSGGGGGGA